MIYDTGDTHGYQYKWVEQIDANLHKGDILIVNGDFGVGFWNGRFWSEETFYDFLSEQEYTVLFADGNHENFDKLAGYPIEEWCGGRVQKIRNNVIHLMRGEIYTIENNTIFVMGGGYSVDRNRRREGVSWWPQEMPSGEEYQNALSNLERVNYRVDYIITHTAPTKTVNQLSTLRNLGVKGNVTEELPLSSFLDQIQDKVTYKHWYFGHFHVDLELDRNQTAVFSSLRELVSGKVIRRWKPYERMVPL